MMRRVLFLAVFMTSLITSVCVDATEYFVDSRGGDDQSTGTAPERAWASLKRVNKADLKPGDVVRFRRDGVWRGKLTTRSGEIGNPIVYSDYGVGDEKYPPRILNSVDLSDASCWELDTENSTNERKIWRTIDGEIRDLGVTSDIIKTFAQGKWHVYTEADAKASCRATTFDDAPKKAGYTIYCDEPGTKDTYLQLTTEGFPVRSDMLVSFRFLARSSAPFSFGGSISVFKRTRPWTGYAETTRRPGSVSNEWKEYDVLFRTNTDAEDGRLTFFLGGCFPKGATFDFIPLEAHEIQDLSLGLNHDVGNLVLTLPGAVKTDFSGLEKRFASTCDKRERAGFKRWNMSELKTVDDFWYDLQTRRLYLVSPDNPGKIFESIEAPLRDNTCVCAGHDVIVENITFSHTGSHGISLPLVKRAIIRNCAFDWIGGGDLYNQGGAGKRTRYGNGVEFWDGSEDCLVEKCRFSRIYDVAITTQGPGLDVSKNLVMRDNLMYRCEQAFEIWFTNPETIVEGLVFEHNLCIDSGRDWSHIQRPDKTAAHILGYGLDAKKVDITIRNNIFYDTAQFFIKCWHNRISEYKINDNVYWICDDKSHFSGDKYFCYDASRGKAPMTFEDFRAATGHDEDSRWIEPKFLDYSSDDFTLTNSDEVGAGPRVESWKPLW